MSNEQTLLMRAIIRDDWAGIAEAVLALVDSCADLDEVRMRLKEVRDEMGGAGR